MTGTDLLVDVGCIAIIVGCFAVARWQGFDDRRREQRLEQLRGYRIVDRVEQYGWTWEQRQIDTFIDDVLGQEKAA